MKKTKFKNLKNKNLSNFTHIIYTHTFTDDQLTYGYDGFVNSLEWLEFTLNILSKNINNRIIVKIHPRVFSNDFKGDTDSLDRKVFKKVIKKYQSSRVLFINEPIKNSQIIKKLNKKTIVISHHGTALIEGMISGFKCIGSTATFWSKNFKLCNNWSNRKEYKNLLLSNYESLDYHNKIDLNLFCKELYVHPNRYYGKDFFANKFAEFISTDRYELMRGHLKLEEVLNKKKKNLPNLYKEISKTIEIV